MTRIKGVIGNFSDVVESERKEKGCATLKHLKLSDSDARMSNLRAIINGESGVMRIESGDYIQLYVHGELMMSDTLMERRTNDEFIANAHGKVMIAGLGVGMILEALIPLCESGVVTSVVVYEKYQDVIDLVGHRYINRMPLEIRLADIMEYVPPKDEMYDTIYFDIWPTISEDNLDDIRKLHNRWKYRKNIGGWMDSWMAHFLRRRRDNEKRRDSRCWW